MNMGSGGAWMVICRLVMGWVKWSSFAMSSILEPVSRRLPRWSQRSMPPYL